MKVVSVAEMRQIDEIAQTRYGIDAFELMTVAGRGIADTIIAEFQPAQVCVVCGKGNNAGDGFVVAQRLHECGCEVQVFCLEEPSAYKGAAEKAWNALSEKIRVGSTSDLKSALQNCDVVVDALLGTGISGAPREAYAAVIRLINECGKKIVSVDVPSGLREMAAGEDPGDIVRANLTVTVGLPKSILLTLPGSDYAGSRSILTINFPDELLTSDDWRLNWATRGEMCEWLPRRLADSNKGTWGHVGIIGAALEYAGATAMVARGALRAGCGLATIYTLQQANIMYKILLPESTSVLIGGADDQAMSGAAADHFLRDRKDHNVLVMGPGLGQSPGAKAFVPAVLNGWSGPLILDADALNILSDSWQDMLRERENCLVTPHPGEMARLTGRPVYEVQEHREDIAREFAQKYGVTVLLKGAGTLIARPDGQVWIVTGAEAALAKGGTGDVLAGIIAGLFAQGMPLWQAAVVGASAHLQAGRQCAKRFGKRGVLASDVADEVPRVLDKWEGDGDGGFASEQAWRFPGGPQ